jgi:hypothetical protein
LPVTKQEHRSLLPESAFRFSPLMAGSKLPRKSSKSSLFPAQLARSAAISVRSVEN